MHKPEQVIKSVMTKLEKHGKGIVLMHDFQHATAEAMPELLAPTQSGRLQDRPHGAEGAGDDAAKYDDMVAAAGQAVVEQHAAGEQRRQTISE